MFNETETEKSYARFLAKQQLHPLHIPRHRRPIKKLVIGIGLAVLFLAVIVVNILWVGF